jgi:hypothetical protein
MSQNPFSAKLAARLIVRLLYLSHLFQILHQGVRYNCRVFCLNHQIVLIRPKLYLVNIKNPLFCLKDPRLMMVIIGSLAISVAGRDWRPDCRPTIYPPYSVGQRTRPPVLLDLL